MWKKLFLSLWKRLFLSLWKQADGSQGPRKMEESQVGTWNSQIPVLPVVHSCVITGQNFNILQSYANHDYLL